jgi:hypothetical protein
MNANPDHGWPFSKMRWPISALPGHRQIGSPMEPDNGPKGGELSCQDPRNQTTREQGSRSLASCIAQRRGISQLGATQNKNVNSYVIEIAI